MKIYIIRHGESTSDIKEKYDGDYDDHLTDKGLKEAETIAKKLLDSKIQIIFSSSKIRAIETSEILKNALKCKIVITEDMNEQNIYGAYPELSKNQPEEEYRRLGEVMTNRDVEIEGVETYLHFKNRVVGCFSKISNEDYQTVAIITHGGPIRCIFRDILKMGEFKKIGNGAIVELEKNDLDFAVTKIDGAILQ
ncbi:MAG: phosphoglycerate mutase [Parcubacteria group bacterium GW2011_GWA2_38_13]|nr:MAG: phosphoglycerate mutase [Parcubacteria group bacterium GW2011_GWA2_38_13]